MTPSSWTIKGLLGVASKYLEEKEIENPRLNAEVLLARQLGLDRVKLYLNFDKPLTQDETAGYRELIRRRTQGEPLQYITGVQEFWSLAIQVNGKVLIPRPETEILVETALEKAAQVIPGLERDLKILEIGTGSGAVSIAIAKELQDVEIFATDISLEAIETATINAATHGVTEKIEFIEGNMYTPLSGRNLRFDIIISNPPYVDHEDMKGLPREVRDHEPHVALDGGKTGMQFIRGIITNSAGYLENPGWLILEMSPEQTKMALQLIEKTGMFNSCRRYRDYSGLYRMVTGQIA